MTAAIERQGRRSRRSWPRHGECSVFVDGTAEQLFAYVDDHKRFSSHMGQSSWKMGGAKMTIETDANEGKRVGSTIRLAGRVLGIALSVDEIVIARDPPRSKVWETVGQPRLLVIGHCRMGFSVAPHGAVSLPRVFFDYDLPETLPARLLGYMLGKSYANWCTRQMALDAKAHFSA